MRRFSEAGPTDQQIREQDDLKAFLAKHLESRVKEILEDNPDMNPDLAWMIGRSTLISEWERERETD